MRCAKHGLATRLVEVDRGKTVERCEECEREQGQRRKALLGPLASGIDGRVQIPSQFS